MTDHAATLAPVTAEILRYAAFTDDPATGNPAGVVLDANGMPDARMQEIAAEVGYSETAFVVPGDGRLRTRYFSPDTEVDFCGHATIALAVAMADRDGPGPLSLDTAAGRIDVDIVATPTGPSATLRSVPTRTRPASDDELDAALAALRWARTDLADGYPPHVAFGGVHHPVLAAGSRERLADLDYDFDALRALMISCGWTTVQLFWVEDERTIHARNPFPVGGVVEDPATGAAAAALGGYLRDTGVVTRPSRIRIIQGEDMGRRSELVVDIDPADRTVRVSGGAVRIPDAPPTDA
jgi:PhzF family phenazine biosynthesis protein